MRKCECEKDLGITWTENMPIADPDFPDDHLVLLSSQHPDVQENIDRRQHFAGQVGLITDILRWPWSNNKHVQNGKHGLHQQSN